MDDIGEIHVVHSELEKKMLDLILTHGLWTIKAKLSVAESEIHLNPKYYIDKCLKEEVIPLHGNLKRDRIRYARYLTGMGLEECKNLVEELYPK